RALAAWLAAAPHAAGWCAARRIFRADHRPTRLPSGRTIFLDRHPEHRPGNARGGTERRCDHRGCLWPESTGPGAWQRVVLLLDAGPHERLLSRVSSRPPIAVWDGADGTAAGPDRGYEPGRERSAIQEPGP